MKRVKRCYMTNCFAVAPFASPANPDVHACEQHKKRDFVNMRNKRCLAAGCYRNPHYGISRAVDPNSKAQYCTEHKSPGMENVNGGRCAGPGCTKQPRFALPGSKGKFCSKHREAGMVDVLYTPCATEGCAKHPHFGFADGGPRYCAQHRAEGMVDVKHRRCAVKGCRRDRLQLTGGPRKRGKFCEIHCAESELVPGKQSRIAQQAKKTAPACTYESEDQNKRKRDADMYSPGHVRAESGGASPVYFPLPVETGSDAQTSSANIRGEEMAHLRDKMSSAPEGTACPSHATDPSQTVPSILWERKCVVCPSQAEDCHTARLAPPAPVVRKQVLDPRTAWLEERSRGGLPPFCRGAARRLERTNGEEHDNYQGEGISSFGVVHHRSYCYPYPLFHPSSEASKNVMPISSCENPPQNARRRVREDQLKPFRLRCWQPSSDQTEEPWYPFPWEILREKWSLTRQETATMRGKYEMMEGPWQWH